MDETVFIIPQMVMVAFAVLAPALDFATRQASKKLIALWTLIGLVVTLLITLNMAGLLEFGLSFGVSGQNAAEIFGGLVVVDSFYYFFAILFELVAIIVVIASLSYIREDEPHQGEFYALLLLSTVGMTIVAFSADFILLFVGLELSTLSTFAMVAYRKKDRRSSEAGIKFFIIGAFSSAILLYGISLLFGVAGTTNFSQLGQILATKAAFRSTLILATVLIIAGIGFKMSTAPFHMWVPDTYQGAPTPVTTFLAAASKKMGFAAAFIIFLIALAALQPFWTILIAILAVVTMVVGNVGAMNQRSMKRLLAYSSIAQAGYMMIAIAVATPFAVAAGLYYILAHALMKGGAFVGAAIAITSQIGDDVDNYSGLRKRAPFLAFAMMIFMLSLAGLPPLAGFWAKFIVFSSAIQAGGILVWLAVAGILNSALSIFYYARVLKAMYINPPKSGVIEKIRNPKGLGFALLVMLVGTILIGLVADPIISYAQTAASALLART